MSSVTCCICAAILNTDPGILDFKTEKPVRNKTQTCCGRVVCAECLVRKPQFDNYCPFCQQTRLPHLPAESLATSSSAAAPPTPEESDPPAYSEIVAPSIQHSPPPAPRPSHRELPVPIAEPAPIPPGLPPLYSEEPSSISARLTPPPETDVLHYVRPNDTFMSLSLAYRVPVSLLKSHNRIATEVLLQARPTISIPWPYTGPSLSSEPEEGFEEHERKMKVRRFMKTCKCADQKMAETYVREANGDLARAIMKWEEDERWVKENPIPKDQEFTSWLARRR